MTVLLEIFAKTHHNSYDALLQEKEQLEEAFEDFKCQVVHSQDRKGSKEIRVLKKVIKNLEVHNAIVAIV